MSTSHFSGGSPLKFVAFFFRGRFQPNGGDQRPARLLLAEPSLLDGGWQLQLAAAYALCIAEGEEMPGSLWGLREA